MKTYNKEKFKRTSHGYFSKHSKIDYRISHVY